jgi:hypothetical protein
MKLSTGLIVVIVSMVFFYLRIALLRGQKRRYEREFALKRRRVNGRSKGAMMPQKPKGASPYSIGSWVLVAVSVIIMLAGLLMYNKMSILGWDILQNTAFVDQITEFWYIPVAVGVILFSFCFKIDKPDQGED